MENDVSSESPSERSLSSQRLGRAALLTNPRLFTQVLGVLGPEGFWVISAWPFDGFLLLEAKRDNAHLVEQRRPPCGNSEPMTADDFVKIVRKGSDKLRVDGLVLQAGERELRGKGMLVITQDKLELQMTFDPGEEPPNVGSGVFTNRDCWKVSGVIETHLHFKCDFVSPAGNASWFNGVTKRMFKLHPIQLIPSGWDALSRKERSAAWAELQHQAAAADDGKPLEPVSGDAESEQLSSSYFRALLVNYEMFAINREPEPPGAAAFEGELKNPHERAFTGEVGDFDFALIKEAQNDDLCVLLKSKKGCPTQSEQADWKKFYAFMRALAFVHGIHAWPYRIEYWREGKKTADKVTTADPLPRTPHAPFTHRLWVDAIVGSSKWDLRDTLKKAMEFFDAETALTKEVEEISFLFREAGDKGVHSEITTIALCALFENLVQTIFRELKIQEKETADDTSLAEFAQAKAKLAEQLREQIDANGEAYRRLSKIVRSASLFSTEKMFRGVARHLNLQWDSDMEIIFDN